MRALCPSVRRRQGAVRAEEAGLPHAPAAPAVLRLNRAAPGEAAHSPAPPCRCREVSGARGDPPPSPPGGRGRGGGRGGCQGRAGACCGRPAWPAVSRAAAGTAALPGPPPAVAQRWAGCRTRGGCRGIRRAVGAASLCFYFFIFFLMCEVTRPKMEAEGPAARRPPAPCEVGIRGRGSARAQRCFCSEVRAFVVPVQQELQPCKPPQFLKGKPVSCLGYYRNASGPSKPSEGSPALCRWQGRAGAAL